MWNKNLINKLVLIVSLLSLLSVTCSLPFFLNNGDEEIELGEDTVVFNQKMLESISSVSPDGNTYILKKNSDVNKLETGNIIIGEPTELTPYGFLRKITQVTSKGEELEISSEPTSLDEAIKNGRIHFQQSLTPDDIVLDPSVKGITILYEEEDKSLEKFSSPAFFVRKAKAANPIILQIEDVVIYDFDGDESTKYDQVLANGEIRLTSDIEFDYEIKWFNVKRLYWVFNGNDEIDLHFSMGGNIPIIESELNLIPPLRLFTVLVLVAGLPVTFTPEILVKGGMNGELQFDLFTSFYQSASFTAGFEYKDDQFKLISEFKNNFDADLPEIKGYANFNVFAGPHLKLRIYEMFGPYTGIMGRFSFESGSARCPKFELFGDFLVNAGVDVDVLSKRIMHKEFQVIDSKNFTILRSNEQCGIKTPILTITPSYTFTPSLTPTISPSQTSTVTPTPSNTVTRTPKRCSWEDKILGIWINKGESPHHYLRYYANGSAEWGYVSYDRNGNPDYKKESEGAYYCLENDVINTQLTVGSYFNKLKFYAGNTKIDFLSKDGSEVKSTWHRPDEIRPPEPPDSDTGTVIFINPYGDSPSFHPDIESVQLVRSSDSKVIMETQTDDRGGFRFENVPPGEYHILPDLIVSCIFGEFTTFKIQAGEVKEINTHCLT